MRAKLRHHEKAFSNVEEVALKVSVWGLRRCARPQVLLSPNLAIRIQKIITVKIQSR